MVLFDEESVADAVGVTVAAVLVVVEVVEVLVMLVDNVDGVEVVKGSVALVLSDSNVEDPVVAIFMTTNYFVPAV